MVNYKGICIIWSPNKDSRFIKVTPKQIDLFTIDNYDQSETYTLLHTHYENDIRSVAWHPCFPDNSFGSPSGLLAIGLGSGTIKLLTIGNQMMEADDFGLCDREIRPRHLRVPIILSWNPSSKNLLAQGIDKTKGSWSNDASILIWEFQKGLGTHTTSIAGSRSVGGSGPYSLALSQLPGGAGLSVGAPGSIVGGGTTINSSAAMLAGPPGNQTKTLTANDNGSDQPNFEFCKGDVVNSFTWIGEKNIICGVSNKYLKLFDLRGPNPLKFVNTEAVYGLCCDHKANNNIASFVDEKIVLWSEEKLDKPILTNAEPYPVESIEWSPWEDSFICVVYKEKTFVKVLDTKIALKNSNSVEHVLVDQILTAPDEHIVLTAVWHQNMERCVLIYTAHERFHLCFVRNRTSLAISVDQSIVWYTDSCLKMLQMQLPSGDQPDNLAYDNSGAVYQHVAPSACSDIDDTADTQPAIYYDFMAGDESLLMRRRALAGYGQKMIPRDTLYSLKFEDCPDLRHFWRWIEDPCRTSQLGSENYNSRSKTSPYIGVIDCIRDVAALHRDRRTMRLEVVFTLHEIVSSVEEARWSGMFDPLPFVRFSHSYRDKIFYACGLPFNKPLDQWRYILERWDNKERAAAIALVTLNFDVALQYLKMIPNDKAIDNEILRLCLAGFNTQGGRGANSHWSMICKDVIKRLGDSRPYLSLIFHFLIAESSRDLEFLKTLNIHLVDKIAISTLYLDDEKLMEFFNVVSRQYVCHGNLEAVVMTGLRGPELIDLLQAYLDASDDVQTAAIAVLQASVLTKSGVVTAANGFLHTPVTAAWVEAYRGLLDLWRLWFVRADFDIANQYFKWAACGKSEILSQQQLSLPSPTRVVPPATGGPALAAGIPATPLSGVTRGTRDRADLCQVYVACHYCGWKISQPSKFTARSQRKAAAAAASSKFTVVSSASARDLASGGTASIQGGASTAMHSGGCKSTICQNCRKPLPRCSVCLMNMDVSGDLISGAGGLARPLASRMQQLNSDNQQSQIPRNPVAHWFVWCQICRHGGHSEHVVNWFRGWRECPVSGCRCQCANLDCSYSMIRGGGA